MNYNACIMTDSNSCYQYFIIMDNTSYNGSGIYVGNMNQLQGIEGGKARRFSKPRKIFTDSIYFRTNRSLVLENVLIFISKLQQNITNNSIKLRTTMINWWNWNLRNLILQKSDGSKTDENEVNIIFWLSVKLDRSIA